MLVGGFENIYIESFPAPTSISPQIIGIIASGEIFDAGNPEIISFIRRFIVTGSAETAYRKAEEIVEYFWPRTQKPTWLQQSSFIMAEYTVKKVFCEKLPTLTKNVGNIFYADCLLRFLTAQ